jgi:streptogramin lyase
MKRVSAKIRVHHLLYLAVCFAERYRVCAVVGLLILGASASPRRAWAAGLLGLPATTASTITQGGSPNFADTYAAPFVVTQNGIVGKWRAQFSPGSLTGGCGIPVGIQLKLLHATSPNVLTVVAAGAVHNPLSTLQTRFGTGPGSCPSFLSDSANAVIEFTESGLSFSPGDIIGVTIQSNPTVMGYFFPLVATNGNTRQVLQDVVVGGAINLCDSSTSGCFTATLAGSSPAIEVDETPVYISTLGGHQILAVGATTGAARVINTDTTKDPEDIVVGQDGKIYVCDADENTIRRMKQDGSQVELVCGGAVSTCPAGPEGPSVGTDGALYFNTRSPSHTGVWKLAGIFAVGFGGPFPAPTQVLTNASVGTNGGTGSTFGEGTTFDNTDGLLVVDRSGSKVVRSASPFTATSTFISATDPAGTGDPIGVGVDSAADVFVANANTQNITRFSSTGAFLGAYVTFSGVDRPFYDQFDATDRLFVATNNGSGANGKVWRVDSVGSPPTTGSAVLLVDLATAFSGGSIPGLASDQAVGLALPPTSKSVTIGLNTGGGTNTYSGGAYNYVYMYPALACSTTNPALMVTFVETTDADWRQRVQGTPFAGTNIVHYAGTGGYGIVARAEVIDGSTQLPATCTVEGRYDVLTNFKLAVGNPNLTGPGFLKAPIGTNVFQNIFTFYDPTTDPTGAGGTCCGFSEFAFISGVTGTAPMVTITTPPDPPAQYTLNQSVLADYSCSGAFVLPPPNGCLGPVPTGSPIDTASVGTKTFRVNAVVSSGPTAVATHTYTVIYNTNGCLLYDPNRAVKQGATFPIKLEVCDVNGTNLSSPSIVLHAISVTMVNSSTTGLLEDSGSANPDFDFRFDSTLAPGGAYIFNLSTKGLTTGTWNLNFSITGDPTTHSASFQVQ